MRFSAGQAYYAFVEILQIQNKYAGRKKYIAKQERSAAGPCFLQNRLIAKTIKPIQIDSMFWIKAIVKKQIIKNSHLQFIDFFSIGGKKSCIFLPLPGAPALNPPTARLLIFLLPLWL